MSTIINSNEIRDIFKQDCERENVQFDEEKFQKFVKFLEIDFDDWIRENLRSF